MTATNQVLEANKDLDFVKRIANPNLVEPIQNDDGTSSTHRMASASDDKGAMAYPTIINRDGKLVELEPKEAYDHAQRTGEFIRFDSDAQAAAFAEGGYKESTMAAGQFDAPPTTESSVPTEDSIPVVDVTDIEDITAFDEDTITAPKKTIEERIKEQDELDSIYNPTIEKEVDTADKEVKLPPIPAVKKPIIPPLPTETTPDVLTGKPKVTHTESPIVSTIVDKVSDLASDTKDTIVKTKDAIVNNEYVKKVSGIVRSAPEIFESKESLIHVAQQIGNALGLIDGSTVDAPAPAVPEPLPEGVSANPFDASKKLTKDQLVKLDLQARATKEEQYYNAHSYQNFTTAPNLSNRNQRFLVYTNSWFNDEGQVYATGPAINNYRAHKKQWDKGTEAVGVAHHMIMHYGDAYDLTSHTSDASLRAATNNSLKSVPDRHFLPIVERLGNNRVKIHYETKEEVKARGGLTKTEYSPMHLKQYQASEINWNKIGYTEGATAPTSSRTGAVIASLRYYKMNLYGKLNGATAVIIYEKNGRRIVQEMTGSNNQFRERLAKISKNSNVPMNKITVGFYDQASFSGKVASKNGKISPSEYAHFNTLHPKWNVGSALYLLTKQQQESPL